MIRLYEGDGVVRYVNKRQRKFQKFRLMITFILCLALACFILVDIRVRPMIKTYGCNQATTAATKAVNDAIERVLQENIVEYDDLITVQKDANGNIISLETNSSNINLMKSRVSEAILEELDVQEVQMIKIPLGSLVGGLVTGRGPNIKIKIPMNSTVETALSSDFESAGINQTRHTIDLDVTVTIYAVIQGVDTAIKVQTSCAVTENILVGKVPNWMLTGNYNSSSDND